MHISEVHLETSEPRLLRDFYSFILGLPLVDESLDGLAVQAGSTRLVFRRGAAARYHFAFNIPTNHYVEAKAWMLHRIPLIPVNYDTGGRERFDVEHRAWNARAFYFYDTAGNVLECIARHDLPNASMDLFSPRSFLNISEVGIVTDDVPATRTALQKRLRAPIYDGADSDTFSALGDENGLLVISQRGRIWMPDTGIPAEIHPLTVVVRGEQETEHTLSGHPYRIIARPSV